MSTGAFSCPQNFSRDLTVVWRVANCIAKRDIDIISYDVEVYMLFFIKH